MEKENLECVHLLSKKLFGISEDEKFIIYKCSECGCYVFSEIKKHIEFENIKYE